jgi:predicted membrane channel-forming protein YqfA (hemolysin III family)
MQGHSHTIFHVLVVAAAVVHWRGSLVAFELSRAMTCPP